MIKMANRFGLISVASKFIREKQLHQLLADYFPALEALGAEQWHRDAIGNRAQLVFFVPTGGIEQEILHLWEKRRQTVKQEPIFLLTHSGNNALPVAMEVLARLQQDGEKGAGVFYISNIKICYKAATMMKLQKLGFPQVMDSHVLLREETSDKAPRRQIVQKDHTIVLLMGDNLNDFDNIFRKKGIVDSLPLWTFQKKSLERNSLYFPTRCMGTGKGPFTTATGNSVLKRKVSQEKRA